MSRTPRHAPRSPKRRVLLAAGSACVMFAVVIALLVLYARPLLAGPELTQLVIVGNLQHISPQAVRAALRPEVGRGFFTTNVAAVREAVAALPWVEAVSVRRGWPHTLYITIDEETPVARWNGDALMDGAGHVFTTSGGGAWSSLPLLSGPDGSAPAVLNEYQGFDALLAPAKLTIRQMDVDARGAATLTLSDGIQVRLGRQQAQVRLERFVGVALQALATQLPEIAYVDMRYTNGFAVGYMPPCRGQGGAGGKRRGMDAAAGMPTMDGSANCGAPCTPAAVNARQGGRAGLPAMDGSQTCGLSCAGAGGKRRGMDAAAGMPTMDGSANCGAPCTPATAAAQAATSGSSGTCSTLNEVQAHG